MATLVSFHAHPDDECIACGGSFWTTPVEEAAGELAALLGRGRRRGADLL